MANANFTGTADPLSEIHEKIDESVSIIHFLQEIFGNSADDLLLPVDAKTGLYHLLRTIGANLEQQSDKISQLRAVQI